MINRHLFIVFLLISFLLLISTEGWPSVQGKIEGVVADSSGNPLDKVKVTIISQKISTRKYEITTDKDGRFVQIGLMPGYYQVNFKKTGFMPLSREVRVRIAESTELEIRLEKAEEFIERKVSRADKFFLEGNKLYEQQEFEEAVQAYREALKINQSQWGYYLNIGLAYKKLDKKEEAMDAFKKAMELNPESYSSNKELGEILAMEGNYEEAKRYYQKATELSPDDPDGFYNLGVCLTNLGESEGALTSFQKVVELKDDYADAFYQMGTIYIGQNRVKEAVESLERFLELAPEHEKADIAKQLLEYLKKEK